MKINLDGLGLNNEDYASISQERMIDIAYEVFGEDAKTRIAWTALDAWANCSADEYDFWGGCFMQLSN